MTDATKHPLIQRAIEHAGSQAKLAEKTGGRISQSAISRMLLGQSSISAEDAVVIEEATGGEVPRWSLRPDLWSRPLPSRPAPAAEAAHA